MSQTQAPQIPVKVDQRKIMTEEKLERLLLARETRARNRIAKEEKRLELAKQMILASAGHPDTKPKSPEEKKLKWQARKDEMIQEMLQKTGEANMRWRKEKELAVPESESELSGMEEPPAKRPKKSKAAVAKPRPPKTKKSLSHTDTSARAKNKRRPVEPAVCSTEESESDVAHENVLQLW